MKMASLYSISILALNNLFDMKKLLALKSNFQGHGVLFFALKEVLYFASSL